MGRVIMLIHLTHTENIYHISDNILSVTRGDIKETKPVLKSRINMLSGMG